ncbi:MAG: response regulator [Anaerolineaceae bacterium]|jgi:CheY-like chemotaxis protein
MERACIVLVEDDVDNLELVQILLDRAGFEVLTAMDGRRGLELIQEKLPELVLVDLTIPEIDGWHLAHQLKADPHTQSIKVVALTAHALPGDRKRALESGCDGYITKPLDVHNFAAQIRAYLK